MSGDAVLLLVCVGLGPVLGVFLVMPLVYGALHAVARAAPRVRTWLAAEQESDSGNARTAAIWAASQALSVVPTTCAAGLWLLPVHGLAHLVGGALGGATVGLQWWVLGRYGFAGLRMPLWAVVLPSVSSIAAETLALCIACGGSTTAL